ncbi:MAG: aldehyde ferredoxin oxidoreductase C-terminal domain-containing protein [bacterium]
MGKILRINMSDLSVHEEDNKDYEGYGGRGFTSMVVSREVPPLCHALGASNKLVISPGLLSGTSAANSGRLSIGGKSPLTGGIKESNVGGTAAQKLARLGVSGIIVEGMPEGDKPHYLVIDKEGARLAAADNLKGLKNYELVEKLRKKHPNKAAVVSIGTAGEFKLSAASIAVTDLSGNPARHAGRGGLGAVMGSKGLKAVVVDDKDAAAIEYADKDAFKQAAGRFREAIRSHPVTKSGGGLATFGTNVLVNVINEAGGFPTRNFTRGKFEGAGKISGEALHDLIKKRGGETTHNGCSNCIIQCSNVFVDENQNYVTSALEYETVWANGANLEIDDLDAIAKIDRLCDDYGLDTIEMGCAIGVAMAAGIESFGDAEGAIELVHEAGNGTNLGRIIGNGAAVTGQAFGVSRVPVVKRQSMPAYDPRAVKGVGVTYATTPMGADHTAGYAVATNIMRVGGFVDPLQPEGQAELSRNLQVATAAIDAAGLCVFISFAVLDNPDGLNAVPEMINARYGWDLDMDAVNKYGEGILKAELDFNRRAGFTKEHDRLPEFFVKEKLAPHDTVFDVPDEDLDGVHSY